MPEHVAGMIANPFDANGFEVFEAIEDFLRAHAGDTANVERLRTGAANGC